MDALISQTPCVKGTLSLPADKAICHRAALLGALAHGVTTVTPWSSADDCQRTIAILAQLGATCSRTPQGLQIHGVGLSGLRAPAAPLDCGESGTTMRLACGVLAGQPFQSELSAGGSLRQRPMRRIVEPLSQMGATLRGAPHPSGDTCPPLVIEGRRPLRGLTYTMPVASAQVKSAVLLAGLFADRPTTVIEPSATRDHTERLLARLGVRLTRQGRAVTITPPATALSAPATLTVPADPSSAAFFLVAAAIVPGSSLTVHQMGLNPSRIHFLAVLQRMGASVRWDRQEDEWEPRGAVTVEFAALHGTAVQADEVPLVIDELPILMVAACAAEGRTRFEGLQELRVKETDRLHAMVTGLKAMGASLTPSPNADLVIDGGRPLRGEAVDSFGDHRTAMSLAVAGLIATGQTRIRHAECVAKSLGEFFPLLSQVAGPSAVTLADSPLPTGPETTRRG